MSLLFLDWSFSFEAICRVVAWTLIVSFVASFGWSLSGFIPRRKAP